MRYRSYFQLDTIALIALVLAVCTPAEATPPVPLEPETDNSEYILDLVTNRYDPIWRDAWDGGDNRFRLRLGSNNVESWFLEEELKASADLITHRLRFRFWHSRLQRHSTEELGSDTFELEGRVGGSNYVSLFATPNATKADNAVGIAIQNRRAIDRFTKVFIEFPHVVRNYTERNKDSSDSLITVFEERPVRLGVSLREELADGFTFWLDGEIIPEFEVKEEEQGSGARTRSERVYARSLLGRLEHTRDNDESRLGAEAGYHVERRAEPSVEWPDDGGGVGPSAVSVIRFDDDLYRIAGDDSISGWRNARWWVQPYAWVPLTDRWIVRGALRVERREIEYGQRRGPSWRVRNRYVIPTVGVLYSIDSGRTNTVEFGWASAYREREVTQQATRLTEHIGDDRLYLSYEYAFSESSRIRIIESFELDGEDRGTYGIHDHGFVQLIVGF